MNLTAGKAARKFNFSRTALLYYDEIGLVRPSQRSEAGYRLYSEDDIERLRKVMLYSEAGIPLENIADLLNGTGGSVETVLLKRLEELNRELAAIRKKQAAVVGLILGVTGDGARDAKARWRAALDEVGFTEEEAERLHADLEENSPQLHAEFLRALGFNETEIRTIREYHRQK